MREKVNAIAAIGIIERKKGEKIVKEAHTLGRIAVNDQVNPKRKMDERGEEESVNPERRYASAKKK